jgi:hypothetical protein
MINLTRKVIYMKIKIIKSEGILCWWVVNGQELIIKPFNPIPSWIEKIRYWKMLLYLKLHKIEYTRCEGCGRGIAKWKIRNPNVGEGNKYLNCCDNCVSFYNRRLSAIRIIKWENGKAIGVRK